MHTLKPVNPTEVTLEFTGLQFPYLWGRIIKNIHLIELLHGLMRRYKNIPEALPKGFRTTVPTVLLKLDALWKMEFVSRVPEGLQDYNWICYPLVPNRVPQNLVIIIYYLIVPVGDEFVNEVPEWF